MAAIGALTFENSFGELKRAQLLHARRVKKHEFEATIVTGQNGSHKSTLLKQIVAVLGPHSKEALSEGVVDSIGDLSKCSLLCISGSPADRFPQKELSSGARTAYDTPSYTYVGQRVMNNLLSRKAPLETILGFSLSPQKYQRYGWRFYRDAHAHAGIETNVSFKFNARPPRKKESLNFQEALQNMTPADDELKFNKRHSLDVSYTMAQWILGSFSNHEFAELQELLNNRPSARFEASFSTEGPVSVPCSPNVLRLGLLLDVVKLVDVTVQSTRTKQKFSLFDLSSGEYHMYLTMLAVGFGVDKETILLMDEPENHLHPQWQRELMATVFGVFAEANCSGQIIISTHSPLIVGSAPQGTSVVDLSEEEPFTNMVTYGASSDELLLSNFGVGSSRNKVVVETVQRAISFVERGDFNSKGYLALIPELKLIQSALTPSDPMIEVVDALLSEGQVQ